MNMKRYFWVALLGAVASATALNSESANGRNSESSVRSTPQGLGLYGLQDLHVDHGQLLAGVHVAWKLRHIESINGVADEDGAISPTRSASVGQLAYHLQVLDTAGSVLSDSGAVPGSAPRTVIGQGPTQVATALTGRLGPHIYRIRVHGTGAAAAWSEWASASLTIGPGRAIEDWGGASWICTSPNSSTVSSSMLRLDFGLPADKAIAGAYMNVIGLGQMRVSVNGQPVSTDFPGQTPGQTSWAKRLLYSTYAVPPVQLKPGGDNTVGIILGNGMYNNPKPKPYPGASARYTKWEGSSGPRILLLRLTVTCDDGTQTVVVSSTAPQPGGSSWAATDGGPIQFTHMYAGEDYNASLAVDGWDAPGFNPSTANPLVAWTPAQDCSGQAPAGTLMPAAFPPVQVFDTLPPLTIVPTRPPGTVMLDIGRNIAGYVTLNIIGVPAGIAVRAWPAETMFNGSIAQGSGGSPMYWQYFTPTEPAGSVFDVFLRPTFSTYGWRWLAVQLINASDAGSTEYGLTPVHGLQASVTGTEARLQAVRQQGASVAANASSTITVLQASYAANCNSSVTGDETSAVAAWCDGTQMCEWTTCVCGRNRCSGDGLPPCIPDPDPANQTCPKAMAITWTCSGDAPGTNRSYVTPGEANDKATPISCLAPANITAAAGHFTRASVPVVGTWASSSDLVNKIHNISVEAFMANLQSVFHDCPHRERLGWLEQSHLLFPSMAYNFDVHGLWSKLALDTVDTQLNASAGSLAGMVPGIAPEYTVFSGSYRDSPEWGSAAVLNPAWLYSWYGNAQVLNDTYATGVAYVNYLLSKRSGSTGLVAYGLNDWLPIIMSPIGVTATAITVQDLHALAAAAAVLGNSNDAANFTALAAELSTAYETAFWNKGNSSYPTQCTAGMALTLGITQPANIAAAQAYILNDLVANQYVTTSGEIGNRFALLTLANIPGGAGIQAVWKSLLRDTSPGYGWMVANGETSLAESWTDDTQQSHIHAMYGHVEEFLYAYVAGIRQHPGTASPCRASTARAGLAISSPGCGSVGWDAVLLAPHVLPGLDWVNATFDSPRGLIVSGYETVRTDAATGVVTGVRLTAEVPPGVPVELVMPLSGRRVRLVPGKRHVLEDSRSG